MPLKTAQEIITEAVNDFAEFGYDSQERLDKWTRLLREALQFQVASVAQMDATLKGHLQTIYDRLVERGSVLRQHQGVGRFTLERVKPKLHAELTRRIMASADLIKLNRTEMVGKTLQRFSGWASSVPSGGASPFDKIKLKTEISKPIRALPYEQRRLLIDQGHKMVAAISATVAIDGGAIAARWFSHWREHGYNYRENHKERDGKVYLIRGSWADKSGFVKPGDAGYTDDITQPNEEVFCRCKYIYKYHLRQLPISMITAKGQGALKKARAAV